MKINSIIKHRKLNILAGISASIISLSGTSNAQIVTNGGFDTLLAEGTGYETEVGKGSYRDQSSINGWSMFNIGLASGIDRYTSGNAVVLKGSDINFSSEVFQVITIASPGIYSLNFDSFTEPFNFEHVGSFAARVKSTMSLMDTPLDLSLTESADGNITSHSYLFEITTAGEYSFGFANRAEDGQTVVYEDVLIDNVSITLAPEPSSTALLGLGALGLISRRKRKGC